MLLNCKKEDKAMMYKAKGVCAQAIEFEIDDNKKVHNVNFIGGCS